MTTSTETPNTSQVAALRVVEGELYRFSTEDFYRMVDLDILPKGNRASLWDGLVYEKPAKTPPHAVVGMKLASVFYRLQIPGWCFSLDNSVTIGPDRSPAPEIAALRGRPEDYRDRRPVAADVGLAVEMTDALLKNDIGRKLAAYAEVGIPSYWVLNLVDDAVYVHEMPIPGECRYASIAMFMPGESIPFTLDGKLIARIAASDILPAH